MTERRASAGAVIPARACKLYSVPDDPERAASAWRKAGFDTLMLGRLCLADRSFLDLLHAEGFRWSVVEPVFFMDAGLENGRPALLRDGSEAVDGWVRFACPSDRDRLAAVADRIRSDVLLGADGVTLDFLRFFMFWETVSPESSGPFRSAPQSFPSTCCCEVCRSERALFADERRWRCSVIAGAAARCAEAARSGAEAVRSGLDAGSTGTGSFSVGIHTVPWLSLEYGGARESVLGQDLAAFGRIADYLTPMTYHQMSGRSVESISAVAADHAQVSLLPVVPCVQASPAYAERPISDAEFAAACEEASRPPSAGFAVYRWEDLAREEGKLGSLNALNA